MPEPIHSSSEAETIEAGQTLGRTLADRDIVALVGGLGMGKTQLTKGIAVALGWEGEVTSPTFGLVHEYAGSTLPVFHFDFYRLEDPAEVIRIGWEEYVDESGVVVVEWADRFPGLFPKSSRWIFVSEGAEEGTRIIEEREEPKS